MPECPKGDAKSILREKLKEEGFNGVMLSGSANAMVGHRNSVFSKLKQLHAVIIPCPCHKAHTVVGYAVQKRKSRRFWLMSLITLQRVPQDKKS